MTVTLEETRVDDLRCLVVETEHLQLAVLPDLGAKVISLRRRESQREFLWRYPGRHFQLAEYAADYPQYDLSGWDECFPTIFPVNYPVAPWQGIHVPDHGELWTLPWQWDFADNQLRMWTHSVRFAYRFERTFHFDEDGRVQIHYAVQNPTAFPFHALWSMHPFLNATPSSRILLPEARVRVEISLHERLGAFLSEHPWPVAKLQNGETIDMSVMGPRGQNAVEKLFTTPLKEGWAALFDESDDHFLAFTFDPAEVPFVGICLIRDSQLGDSAVYTAILEPCNGWPDRLDLAMTRGAGMVIPPQGESRWSVNLHLGQGKAALGQLIPQLNETL